MSAPAIEYTAPIDEHERFVVEVTPDLVQCFLKDNSGGVSWLFAVDPNQARVIAMALQLAANDADQAKPILDVIGPH